MAFLALPFGSTYVFRELDVALVFVLGILGVEVIGVILAGWASNNKWSVYGAMREACQMVSYEIPMGMALMVPVVVVGTLNLSKIGDAQAGCHAADFRLGGLLQVSRQADLAGAAGGIARGAFARDAGAQVLQGRGVELGVVEAAVAGEPDRVRGEVPVAFIVAGSTRFNELRRGVPRMSPALLSKK